MARNKKLQKQRQREWYQRKKLDPLWYDSFLEVNRIAKVRYNEEKPWERFYWYALRRCNDPRNASYKTYGFKGVKSLLTKEDVKYLWFRDEAFKLIKPSIDRKDSNGHYELDNCRFIEWEENSKEGWFNSKTGRMCRLGQLYTKILRDGAARSSSGS